MIKGDKIKLVKPMGAFTNVGEVCEVTDIAEGGIISFRFGGVHLGCMSYDEYKKYFEDVLPEEKREWSEWLSTYCTFVDLDGQSISLDIYFRENGKKTQVKYPLDKDHFIQAESTCNNCDEFDEDKGFDLATKRLIVKYLDRQVKEFASAM